MSDGGDASLEMARGMLARPMQDDGLGARAAWQLRAQDDVQSLHDLGAGCVEKLVTGLEWEAGAAAAALGQVAAAGVWDPTWTGPFLHWWTSTRDLLAYDKELGWVHALVQGAGVVGALGARGLVESRTLLDAVVDRLLAPSTTLWRNHEDSRLAHALAQVLAGPATSEDDVDHVLGRLGDALVAGRDLVPVPDHLVNGIHVLTRLHVLAAPSSTGQAHGAHGGRVQSGVQDLLLRIEPWAQG